MASLAGLLQLQGHRITGSDKAAYPPMSDLLRRSAFQCSSHTRKAISIPAPDLVVIGNALSRGNPEDRARARRAHSLHLDGRAAARRVSCAGANRWWSPERTAKPPPPACWRGSTRSHRARIPQLRAFVSHRRRGGEFRHQLSTASHAHLHPRRRRVRHRLLRQGSEVPALLSRRADSDPRRVRSRRHLRRS